MHNYILIGVLYIHNIIIFFQILPGVYKGILNSNFCEVVYACQKCFNTVTLGSNTMRGTEYFGLF